VHEEVEVTDHFETENDMDTHTARGQEDAISDIPLGGTGVVGNIGVGGGGAGCFGYRTGGGRRRCVAKFGGSRASESAVDAALRWLARHQEPEGDWQPMKYNDNNSKRDYRTGVTGLAILAFLGAGHTEKAGKFKNNVKAAIGWTLQNQKPSGLVYRDADKGGGFDHGTGYAHSIASLALAEAYGMGRNPRVGQAAQKAVDFSVNEHQKEYGGWRYHAKSSEDTSVSGWFIMQLKSSKVAGLKVEGKGFSGAMAWLDKVTTKKGEVAGDEYGGRGRYTVGSEPMPTMTAVVMLGRQFMGFKNNDPILLGGGEYLLENLPKWGLPNSGHSVNGTNFYYWYYGTLSMFQMGGKYWKAWNNSLRDMLVQNQRRGGDEDGSWDPPSTLAGSVSGRVYSTALGALCLEVYYRYLPMYQK